MHKIEMRNQTIKRGQGTIMKPGKGIRVCLSVYIITKYPRSTHNLDHIVYNDKKWKLNILSCEKHNLGSPK